MADNYVNQGPAAQQSYGVQAGSSAYQAPPPPTNPSVFNAFEGIQGEAAHLLARACNLADRLCGAMPQGTDANKQPAPNGLLEDAQMRLGHIRAMIIGATAAIERIEQKLP